MSDRPPLADPLGVAAVGMCSSVGLNALSAAAAIRAHVSRFEEVSFCDARGQPIIAAPAVEAVAGRHGYHRLGPLLCSALADCIGIGRSDHAEVFRSTPCLIVIGESGRPDYPPDIAEVLLSGLQSNFGAQLHPYTRVMPIGAAGFLQAIVHARTLLKRVPACLVVAVDSLINRKMLAWLDSERRLKTEDNSDGVIPGEAAAAVWLTASESADAPTLAQVLGVGLAHEPSLAAGGGANKGVGLADAIRNALAEWGGGLHQIDFRVGSMTGERLGFVEASTALARVQKVHKDDFELWVPAEQIGDVGAALPACMTVATIIAFTKGYAPGQRAILYCSGLDQERAACVLAASVQ